MSRERPGTAGPAVSVFGLGYVGTVCATGLAARGLRVVGVDVSERKVSAVTAGHAPLLEPGLGDLLASQVRARRLTATTDARAALDASDVVLVCVGTPSAANGSLSTVALERVMETIGQALRGRRRRLTVVVRSTVLPGTSEDLLIPMLEDASGRSVGGDFGYAVNPEFLREGTSLADFNDPVKTVIGEISPETGDLVAALYKPVTGPLVRTTVRAAELAKYIDNAFHALKITFANEVGAICRAFNLDSHEVMRSFLIDTRLNISTAYLRPGFAFGGSCLPKDLRALLHASRRRDLHTPVLESVLESNEKCLTRVLDTIVGLGRRRVGMFGLSFKPNTDDLRESPFVELGERLLGKGFDLKIYDPSVLPSQLVGSNREYIAERMPHLSALLAESPEEVLDHAEVCVIGAAGNDTVQALANSNGRVIVDLVRLPDASQRRASSKYIGVGW